MRIDPTTGLVITEPRFTEPHETRATAAIAPPDDTNGTEALTFGDPVINRAFTKYMTDVLVDISDTLKHEREELDEESTHLEKQINALQVQPAELKGQLAQINQRERGPAGPRGERGLKGPPGRQGRKGDPGLSARVPTLRTWFIEREKFRATPVMSDGSHGPALDLRDLFVEFQNQTA
jgi:hypothetical protein